MIFSWSLARFNFNVSNFSFKSMISSLALTSSCPWARGVKIKKWLVSLVKSSELYPTLFFWKSYWLAKNCGAFSNGLILGTFPLFKHPLKTNRLTNICSFFFKSFCHFLCCQSCRTCRRSCSRTPHNSLWWGLNLNQEIFCLMLQGIFVLIHSFLKKFMTLWK